VEEDAEAAAAMFSAAINGKIAERLMSMDNNYKSNVVKSNKYSRFCEEIDDWSDFERENVVSCVRSLGKSLVDL